METSNQRPVSLPSAQPGARIYQGDLFQKGVHFVGANPGPGRGGAPAPPSPALIHHTSNSGIEIPSIEVKSTAGVRVAIAAAKGPTSKKSRLTPTVAQRMAEMDGPLPVWVRAPKTGHERFTGLTRPKLYELAGKNLIRSASLREPGQLRGCRLFNLKSILDFIAGCETEAAIAPSPPGRL
jgi:hypothetical protein